MATDRDEPSGDGGTSEEAASDGDPPVGERLPPPDERANPLVSSLCAGLASSDREMAAQAGIALGLVADHQSDKVSTIIGRLVEQVVEAPSSEPVLRTLATLREDHGREIRGALMTETGYSDARRIYGRVEHAEPWDLAAVDTELPDGDAEPSFISAVMRLIELGNEGRDPLDSDAWTRFIQRLPGEGGESASEEEIELAAAREDGRPRSVRRRHRRIERIANSRTFRIIESESQFDELEVLSPLKQHRFGKAIRARGRIGAEEYALLLRLPHQLEAPGFRRLLGDRLREWDRLEASGVVTVADWGTSPRPWVATDVVDSTLATRERLSTLEALDHARSLTRSLVTIHQHGMVHGGIDPRTVGYPPSAFEGSTEPMLDTVGLGPVYRRHIEPERFLDIRYAGPEYFDGQYGGVDGATDIYGLGMVIYRGLTGTAPFEGDGETVRERIKTARPTPPSEVNPNLPSGIDDIISKATAKQKLLRYENATRFHQEVRNLCDERL